MKRAATGIIVFATLGLGCAVGTGGSGDFGGEDVADTKGDQPGDGGSGGSDDGSGDGQQADGGDGDDGNAYLDEARKKFPTYLKLHNKVVQRTCTPFENVCHNNMEYPDLRTPESMLDALGGPCNIVELNGAPTDVFNGCEPPPDKLRFIDGANVGFSTDIAFVEFPDDPMVPITSVVVHLREAVPQGMIDPLTLETVVIERNTEGGMLSVGMVSGAISYAPGNAAVQVNNYDMLTDDERTLLEADIVPGDPNEDGTFGADDPSMAELVPGDPWNSYLLQRLQGAVPGSPMPLANQPLTAAEVVALACWIEGADKPEGQGVYAEINYDDCQYAAEFGEPPEGGGATLSGHVQPILDTYCSVNGCHGENQPQLGLKLTEGNSRAALVEVMSTQEPMVPLVEPGNPTNSYLITKLTSRGVGGGEQMPPGTTLPESELEIIRTWIIQGAPDN